jgi:uncharacterized protein YegL
MSSKFSVPRLFALLATVLATTTLAARPASAFSCSPYTSQVTCQATPSCAWSATYSCACNSTAHAQVIFVLDSSASVTASGWTQAKNFVARMIETSISPGSKVGVISFSTTATTALHFDSDQSRASLAGVVRALPWLQGQTDTAAAMKKVISMIDAHNAGLPTYVILITDGNPSGTKDPNPCSATNAAIPTELAARGVTTILAAVGSNIAASTLACLYNNDASRVVSAASYTSAALQTIQPKIDDFLCK